MLFFRVFLNHRRFLFVSRVRRTFFALPDGAIFSLLPCDHGLDSLHQLLIM